MSKLLEMYQEELNKYYHRNDMTEIAVKLTEFLATSGATVTITRSGEDRIVLVVEIKEELGLEITISNFDRIKDLQLHENPIDNYEFACVGKTMAYRIAKRLGMEPQIWYYTQDNDYNYIMLNAEEFTIMNSPIRAWFRAKDE